MALGAGWFYHDLLEQNHNFGALMVAVNIPLSGWWGGSHAIKRKSLALENARNELTDLGEKLEIGMQDKWNSLTAAHRKMDIAYEGVGKALRICGSTVSIMRPECRQLLTCLRLRRAIRSRLTAI